LRTGTRPNVAHGWSLRRLPPELTLRTINRAWHQLRCPSLASLVTLPPGPPRRTRAPKLEVIGLIASGSLRLLVLRAVPVQCLERTRSGLANPCARIVSKCLQRGKGGLEAFVPMKSRKAAAFLRTSGREQSKAAISADSPGTPIRANDWAAYAEARSVPFVSAWASAGTAAAPRSRRAVKAAGTEI